jgi:hypothetical protein
MTRTNCDLFTHNQSRSYLNHLVYRFLIISPRLLTNVLKLPESALFIVIIQRLKKEDSMVVAEPSIS